MTFVRRGKPGSIANLLRAAERAEPTYAALGATLAGEFPPGFRRLSDGAVIGSGFDDFVRASEGLRTWQAHRLPGVTVFPRDARLETGATVLVTAGTDCCAIAAPCRIVGVVDEPKRFGFAYGTLPGHPEQGEEAFVVTIGEDDVVRFEISAFSRPGDFLTRLTGPVGRALQRIVTKGYLGALRRFTARATSAPSS